MNYAVTWCLLCPTSQKPYTVRWCRSWWHVMTLTSRQVYEALLPYLQSENKTNKLLLKRMSLVVHGPRKTESSHHNKWSRKCLYFWIKFVLLTNVKIPALFFFILRAEHENCSANNYLNAWNCSILKHINEINICSALLVMQKSLITKYWDVNKCGHLNFLCWINFMLSWVEHGKVFHALQSPVSQTLCIQSRL